MSGCLPLIPVSRVTDLTPLDRLRLPVYCAVTPLALDLTTHLGKGASPDAARTSALMEAIERASAERMPAHAIRGSLRDLSSDRSVHDPTECDLPDDTRFTPATELTWVPAHDLMRDEPVWLCADLAVNPPREDVLRSVDTNGLAAGNSILEAVLHGLCEVIERDAVGQALFFQMFGDAREAGPNRRRVALGTLPDAGAALVERATAPGYDLVVEDVTSDVGVATFRAVLIDPAFPGRGGVSVRRFLGYGTDPCAEVALLRSITEAVQSRLAVVQGARDSFNRAPRSPRPSFRHAQLADLRSAPEIRWDDIPTFESVDLADDLRFVLDRLREAGFAKVLAADLTHAEWGVPVVRVRVPGLTSFLVNRRRPGLRCLRWLM